MSSTHNDFDGAICMGINAPDKENPNFSVNHDEADRSRLPITGCKTSDTRSMYLPLPCRGHRRNAGRIITVGVFAS